MVPTENTRTELLVLLGIQPKDLDWRDAETASSVPSALINKLARLITQSKWTEVIASTFPALVGSVLEEAYANQYYQATNDLKDAFKFNFTVAVSKLIRTYPSVLQFVETFFSNCGSPLSCLSTLVHSSSSASLSKKPKRQTVEYTVEDAVVLLESVLILLKVLPLHITRQWALMAFLELPRVGDKKLTWLSLQCVAVVLCFSDAELDHLIHQHGINSRVNLEFGLNFQARFEAGAEFGSILNPNDSSRIIVKETGIISFPGSLVAIGGALVKVGRSSTTVGSMMVQLDSTVSYLRDMVLSMSFPLIPICLMGPIGSGKSTLVKCLARLFGRESYPALISIQMSDQIDARLLLGSYHSTDLPGQFQWKPGSLTKAVLKGYWIVLEDVDSAPADVMALFDGLMDTHKLSVPGYGDIDRIHPEFRVFATCRTQAGKRNVKLGKRWRKIFVETLSSAEMKSVISQNFPHLNSLAERLIGIFEAVGNFQLDLSGRQGRAVSMRDFLKFCRRISPSLELTQTSAAIVIFQEACALFINSFPSPETRQEIAELIGTQLNLLRAKAEYFCTTYKPHINICTNSSVLTSGRYSIPMFKTSLDSKRTDLGVFSLTKKACRLVETLVGSVICREPVLLIGETGVGKTSCIQFLANVLRQKLIVVNLNRQSDSGDLLGGYKPVELKYIFRPIREEFEALFVASFDSEANSKFLGHIMTCFANRRWNDLVRLMIHVQKTASKKIPKTEEEKMRIERWATLGHQLARIQLQISMGEESPFAFSFIEGTLVTAIKNGYWILLDEINLATPEMLQCLSGILEEDADIHLWEKGDEAPISRHPNFHLFAAMNPATDVGKKDLPLGLRNRFTEVYVEELTDRMELQVLVSDYLKEMALASTQIENLVEFYLTVKSLSQSTLVDGMGKKPHFSLRTLCRALKISTLNLYGSATRSLYESFCLSFLTQLDYSSHPVVQALVAKHIFGKTEIKSVLNQALPCPQPGKYLQVEGYWVPQGDLEPRQSDKYILTPSIRRNLKDLARIISAGRLPVLIQGETSVGKTSLIQYLATTSGNQCYRINNHQHTDLQEYIGSYQSDQFGKLVFTEGILVTAMRRGEWIILDELNLAPSEVLEALNRLLDDNRQLFITETGQTVTAHPRFMLFATQNPPGLYGGRKILSRAFRNRFIELHFDEIPSAELETILHYRCNIPQSYCKKIIGVLRELQVRRKASAALEGKHGFATLRDLFRWAERYRQSGEQLTTFYDWDQHLADEGYLVLAGKVRKSSEAEVIREVIQKHLKRTVDPNNLFSLHDKTSSVTRPILETLLKSNLDDFRHIVWTFQMRRLGVLIGSSLKFKEPILMVGETGGGKTSVVQLLSKLYGQKLYTVNCHMHSESSDFLGGLRPIRSHQGNDSRLFEWVHGPLVEAMEGGGIFLADEISLADDSVLERINSVLEPERTLLLAEKGDETPKLIEAHDQFYFIGTMNPGGDYGKKELSPALRNRLTEIWCEVSSEPGDIEAIVEHNLLEIVRGKGIAGMMIEFVQWLKSNELGTRCTISIRDYLGWTEFINRMIETDVKVTVAATVIHGACLTFLDGLGSGTTSTENVTVSHIVKCQALTFLEELTCSLDEGDSKMDTSLQDIFVSNTPEYLGIGPFFVTKSATKVKSVENNFNLEAPTTSQNALRVLRGMTLKKPILLEGSPGVGKTALVNALGMTCHRSVVRINLSEQTDISDLFGADLPVEGGTGGEFSWRDGPLLQALKSGAWILLDELNLASQSVLEGLNACLDHRGEIYVPELNRTFRIGENTDSTRIFACQNPVRQGGARKGLPKSFLNRFTQVFMDPLSIVDLKWIIGTTFPKIPERSVEAMAMMGETVVKSVSVLGLFGSKGSPWDFNLRDLLRWGKLVEVKGYSDPGVFVDFIYGQRMRTKEDHDKILALFAHLNQVDPGGVLRCGTSGWSVSRGQFHCGHGSLTRVSEQSHATLHENLMPIQKQLPGLEALTLCLEMGWMPILVGPSKSGKTSIVKLLAEMTGHDLKIMTVSPEMDTIELLGGFEQADIYRKIDESCGELRRKLEKVVKSIVGKHKGNNLSLMDSQLLDLWSSLYSLPSLIQEGELLSEEEELRRIECRVKLLEDGVKACQDKVKSEELSGIGEELERIRIELKSGIRNGAFHWVDSGLVKAIRDGKWVLIDGANRCTAAVLDRLNSVMEVDGSLVLSERGSVDGKIMEMKPHPDFRLVLTIDPAYGEISRAMRNRGVEIYLPGPEEVTSVEGDAWAEESSLLNSTFPLGGINWIDLDALYKAQGWTSPGLRKDLVNLHKKIYEVLACFVGISDRPHIYQAIETVQRFGMEMLHGTPFVIALRNALTSVYLKANLTFMEDEVKGQVEQVINSFKPTENGVLIEACSPIRGSITDFLSAQHYRAWRVVRILETALENPSIVEPLERIKAGLKAPLLKDLLMLTPFLRIGPGDARALEGVMAFKFPKVNKGLTGILERHDHAQQNPEVPWDPFWKRHFLAELSNYETWDFVRISKTSLLLHAHLFRSSESEIWNARSVGDTARSVSQGRSLQESVSTSELYKKLWTLLEKFDEVFLKGLEAKGEKTTLVSGSIWRSGLTSWLWRSRLFAYAQSSRNLKTEDLAHLILLVQWIGEEVVPFLNNLGAGTGLEMEFLVKSILTLVEHVGGTSKMLESSRRLRIETGTKPFSVSTKKAGVLEEILGLFFSGWALGSTVEVEKLTTFMMSVESAECAENLQRLIAISTSESSFTEDDTERLVRTKGMIEKLTKRNDLVESEEGLEKSLEMEDLGKLQRNVRGLTEFIRMEAAVKISSFINPLMFSDFSQIHESWSGLSTYLNWEEGERFRSHFLKTSNYSFVPLTPVIPLFVSKVIIDELGRKYRVTTLASREVFTGSLETLKSILARKVTSKGETDEAILNRVGNSSRKVLERLTASDSETVRERFSNLEGSEGTVEEKMVVMGELLVSVGLELMATASYLPTVDPAVESRILAGYLAEEITFFENWVGAQRIYELLETGQSMVVHPSFTAAIAHLNVLRQKLVETQKLEAFRPVPPNYDGIRQDLKQFINSFMNSGQSLGKLKSQLTQIFKGSTTPTPEMIQDALTSCCTWIDSHRNFVKKVFKHWWYWDITAGFLSASVQVSIGLMLICTALNRCKLESDSKHRNDFDQLIEFPLKYRASADEKALSPSVMLKNSNPPTFSKSMFTAALISFLNEIETEGYASSAMISKLHNLTASVSAIWNRQEEEKQKAKELEDAMYVFKGKGNQMEVTDDEEEAMEISSTFPTYVEDLIDFEVQNALESGTDKKDNRKFGNVAPPTSILTSEEVSIFLKIHRRVLSQLKTHWLCGEVKAGATETDFVAPYLMRFQAACIQFQDLYEFLGKREERQFILGASLAIQALKNDRNPENILKFHESAIYDFYHDPNINEVYRLSSVFNGLRKRVRELLQEWADHPSLLKILEVISRIESFQTTSPLMRFLTGLELLLSTAQEWESCAHHGVSIALYLSEITEIIIAWRKLELQCWKNLLELTSQREEVQNSKWFFHVYSTLMEIVSDPKSFDQSVLLGNLHQLMESSSLSQFQARLQFLLDFHRHLISIDQISTKNLPSLLLPYIWNTFNYYNQFSDTVRSKLEALRVPIEKKMKDFVKISRWNDANYYALKDSVQKNQRMLTKLVKEWKKAMMTPVTSVLVADVSGTEVQKFKGKVTELKPKVYLVQRFQGTTRIDPTLSERFQVKRLGQLEKIFKKTQKVLKPVLDSEVVKCRGEIDVVEELTGTIIQDVKELQTEEVTEKSGEQRRKMLHNVHFRKRAALADLFKILQQLNISYRRGLVELTRNDKIEPHFRHRPVDIAAGWNALGLELHQPDEDLISSWGGCELYFQKCLARLAVMMKAFESPSKELGPRIIERCKGFVMDLMTTATVQKDVIANFTQKLWVIRTLTTHNYGQGQESSEFDDFYQESCRLEYETQQLKLLVESLQSSQNVEIVEILNTILVQAGEVKEILKIYVDTAQIRSLPRKLMEGRVDLEHCYEMLNQVAELLRSLATSNQSVLGDAFVKMAITLEEFLKQKATILENQAEVLPLEESLLMEKFGRGIKFLLQNILVTYQKLDKLKTAGEDKAKEISDGTLELGTNVKELLKEEMQVFDLDGILKGLILLVKIMQEENCTEFSVIFDNLTSIFQQYSLMAQFYLTIYVQFHRATCKLLSVLLGIFSTLGLKGFCLPADYEEDAVGESEEMDSAAGMGMGEGETTSDAQDVSDRLESEDQLEDTLKNGEAPPSADKDLNDDEKGVEMSEDFEGKQQDKEKKQQEGDNEEEDNDSGSEDEEEFDKQMGEVDDLDAEKLDDQMWGGSSDEEDENLDEKDEEQGKGSNRQAEPELRAKDPSLETDQDQEPETEQEKNDKKGRKEFNEQDDEEVNDNQADPYHGQQSEEKEPEEFELPEDLNLDGAEPKDDENELEEENPFDLDAVEKDDVTEVPENSELQPEPEQNGIDENQVSEEEDSEADKGVDVEKPQFEDESEKNETESAEPEPELETEVGMEIDEKEEETSDKAETETGSDGKNEEKAEPSETKDGTQDQTSVANEKAKGEQMQEAMEITEEDKSKQDESASGQAESKDGTGHEGKSVQEEKNQTRQQEQKDENASRKPGDTDQNRSLANDQKLPDQGAKRLKTLDRPESASAEIDEEETKEDDIQNPNNAELYQHIKDSQKSDAVTVDNSTREQAEKQDQTKSESKPEDDSELNPELEEEAIEEDTVEEMDIDEIQANKPEQKVPGFPEKSKRKGDHEMDQDKVEPAEIEVDGDIIATVVIQRPADSVIETRFDLLEEWTKEKEQILQDVAQKKIEVKQKILTSEEESAALAQWHELDGKTLHLAQELCEQLRLVLEPSQAARLKGDYKTGKRLNMRKVIPYIASGFRKDKIWLRRTQPSKREYQILLALDDSASMADNQSKLMAFSAVAVVARSLGLLESGQLGVVGFGEDVQLLHAFEEPFTDSSGAKLVQRFTFAQRATRIAQLLQFTEKLFEQAKDSQSSALSPEIAQLLLIVSDGRGVAHEGSGLVKRAVRHARDKNIFIVFIVVDNPENKDSILDIRLPIFGKDGSLVIAKYMDHFPFPFYLILRDLSALPSVLSDALRQWFELVTSSER